MSSIFTCCHGETIRPGEAWRDKNGVRHPPNWQIWSAEEKTAAGITEVVQESPPDSRLYTWSHNADGTINKTAKALADSGSGDTLVLGVKSSLKQTVNGQQGSLLSQTDWYITRRSDTGKAVPAEIKEWRDAIRAAGDAMCEAIDAAADHDAIAALFVWHDADGTKNGVLYDWPEGPVP